MAWLTLLGVGPPPAPAEPDLSTWRIEQVRSSYPIGAAEEVQIVNDWGAVNLRAGESDELVITSAVQRHCDDPRAPEFAVEKTPSGFKIVVRFDDRLEVGEEADWQNRRIDIGVFVPETLALSIRTGEDPIEVRDLVAPADLESTSGDIVYRGPGGLRAHSETGSITAQFRRSNWSEPVEIETRTGDIRVDLLEGAAASAEIETRGSITTDFSMAIERRPGSRLKRGIATIGVGGQTLKLTSYSGAIRLTAVIVPEEKDGK